MCNTFISGATGKVGRILIEKVLEDKDLKLVGGSASKESNNLGKDLGALIGKQNLNINLGCDFVTAKNIDLIIDFSRPQHSMEALRYARKENIPVVLGTTGFSEIEFNEILKISQDIPLLIAPIGNSLTPYAKFLPLMFDLVKSPTLSANPAVTFEGSRSAEPPTKKSNDSQIESKIGPHAFLVAIF